MASGNFFDFTRMALGDPSYNLHQTEAGHLLTNAASLGGASRLNYYTADVSVWKRKIGEITGEGKFRGQCANLVQYATNIGETKWWLQGPKVMGNKAIPPGTAIAAGWVDGHYKSYEDGNTAAIFLAHDADGSGGFTCLHQWVRADGSIQPIYVDHMPSKAQNDKRRINDRDHYVADMFNVILTVRMINDPIV